jgi:hypothetical protein
MQATKAAAEEFLRHERIAVTGDPLSSAVPRQVS